MTNLEFQVWLSGYLELTPNPQFTQQRINIIRAHANLVKAIEGFLTAENQTTIDKICEVML